LLLQGKKHYVSLSSTRSSSPSSTSRGRGAGKAGVRREHFESIAWAAWPNVSRKDLHLHGQCFTWSNERDNPTLVRLDPVLVSVHWEEMFPGAHLRGCIAWAQTHRIIAHSSSILTWAACPRLGSILRSSGPVLRIMRKWWRRLGVARSLLTSRLIALMRSSQHL
jgi:hypothetical protein